MNPPQACFIIQLLRNCPCEAGGPQRTVPTRGPVTYQMNPRLFLYCQMQSNVYSLGNIFLQQVQVLAFSVRTGIAEKRPHNVPDILSVFVPVFIPT